MKNLLHVAALSVMLMPATSHSEGQITLEYLKTKPRDFDKEPFDFDTGLAAYKASEYAAAMLEWTPLAKKGNADAQLHLGYMYFFGKGVPQDLVTAHMWINIAMANGAEAFNMLSRVASECIRRPGAKRLINH